MALTQSRAQVFNYPTSTYQEFEAKRCSIEPLEPLVQKCPWTDMDRVCGSSSIGGWTRAANLNMSDPSEQCPGEWTLQTYSSEPRRLCGGVSSGTGCVSAIYSTYGINYSQVCGRLIGYQYHAPDAFSSAIKNPVSLHGH